MPRQLERLTTSPVVVLQDFTDTYGNLCGRAVVSASIVSFQTSAVVEDDGLPDIQAWTAYEHQ